MTVNSLTAVSFIRIIFAVIITITYEACWYTAAGVFTLELIFSARYTRKTHPTVNYDELILSRETNIFQHATIKQKSAVRYNSETIYLSLSPAFAAVSCRITYLGVLSEGFHPRRVISAMSGRRNYTRDRYFDNCIFVYLVLY